MADTDRTYLVPTQDDLGADTDDLHQPTSGASALETRVDVGKHYYPSRQLSLDNVHDAVTLSWKNLHVEVPLGGRSCCRKSPHEGSTTKTILSDVSGIIRPGSLVAIMGASGAGKSTLLNVLTQRNVGALTVTGDVLVNGQPIGQGIQKVSAYVQQVDLFVGYVTVREHLWFTAMLRMGGSVSGEERTRHIERVIQELGLTKCANSLIGEVGSKQNISGGEKKRLAFASEVLTNPAMLFCDEPTSGLDSFMAASVVKTLKDMASQGKTILCTIHQPASEVFAQFDNLILLAEGQVAYMGTSTGALDFFSRLGHPCPPSFNPADHFIATLAIMPGNEAPSERRVAAIIDANATSVRFQELMQEIAAVGQQGSSDQAQVASLTGGSTYKASAWRQFLVVTWRCWASHMRNPIVFRGRVGQAVMMAVLFGLIYLRQTYDQKGVTNINGALFLLQIGGSIAYVFGVINTFTMEYPVFLREHQNGMYNTLVYFLSKVLAELPTFLITPAIFGAIAYWMIGFNPGAKQFGIYIAVMVLIANVAVSFGYMTSCLSDNVTIVLTITPLIQTPLMLFGGFFLNTASIPVWLIWMKYISWFSYANEILVVNQWTGVTNITCPRPDVSPTHLPPAVYNSLGSFGDELSGPSILPCFTNGDMIIKSMSFDPNNLTFDFIMLAVLVVAFKFLAYIFLVTRTWLKK